MNRGVLAKARRHDDPASLWRVSPDGRIVPSRGPQGLAQPHVGPVVLPLRGAHAADSVRAMAVLRRRLANVLSTTRVVTMLSLGLAAGPFLVACDKGDGATETPGGEKAKKGDGIEFAYSDGFELNAEASVVFEIAGAQSGLLEMSGTGKLVAAKTGEKLKVTTTIEEITALTVDGAIKKQLSADADAMKAAAKGSQNWLIVGLDGEIDEDATEALPEVKAKREAAEKRQAEAKAEADAEGGDKQGEAKEGEGAEGEAADSEGDEASEQDADLGEFGSQLLSLPSLPKTALKPGKETKMPTEEEEFPLGGDTMPVETDRTYTLESIDDSSGERIATVKIVEEGSGAKEFSGPQGSAFVAVEQESTATLVFNLDRGTPVSFEAEQASALSFGDQTFEQIVEISYKFTPAG